MIEDVCQTMENFHGINRRWQQPNATERLTRIVEEIPGLCSFRIIYKCGNPCALAELPRILIKTRSKSLRNISTADCSMFFCSSNVSARGLEQCFLQTDCKIALGHH